MTMITKSALLIPATLTAALSTAATAEVTLGETLGTEDAAITAALEAKGYTVTEIEREDDEIEVEATLGGKAYEIELSPDGAVTEIELDD